MEIPYVVTPRKDTGLFNSKIAIWLFLASEVMLFGGFFSAYVFLRLGADYPWPERTLPVLPGLINTFVLIGSSVTVVFAWAALKLRNWRHFQIYMGITVACALIFMVLKAVEYNVKFQHQAVRLADYTVLEGHLDYRKNGETLAKDHKNRKIEENRILVEASKITFNTVRYHKPWVEDVLAQAAAAKASLTLEADIQVKTSPGKDAKPELIAKAGSPLDVSLLNRLRKAHLAARAHNSNLRIDALRDAWSSAKQENPDKRGWEISTNVQIDNDAIAADLLGEIGTVSFRADPPFILEFRPRDIREGSASSTLRDSTVIDGALQASPMRFEHIDAIDFQHLAMKAVAKGFDPMAAIEKSWLMENSPFVREIWAWHMEKVAAEEKRLLEKYGTDPRTGKARREPTLKERYRIGWKEMGEFAIEVKNAPKLSGTDKIREEFMGPNYHARGDVAFPAFEVPREQIGFASKFTPAWNTYYALYFTITGLHGLHVIGGALVLAYYLFFGRRMFDTNPEWLANRVEVGGLFWHFVDLVWIFVFPILYLM
jgi:heme/copper-type cytochrome/quinol oxidase subunit 3